MNGVALPMLLALLVILLTGGRLTSLAAAVTSVKGAPTVP
jgi:hypothetical protein